MLAEWKRFVNMPSECKIVFTYITDGKIRDVTVFLKPKRFVILGEKLNVGYSFVLCMYNLARSTTNCVQLRCSFHHCWEDE